MVGAGNSGTVSHFRHLRARPCVTLPPRAGHACINPRGKDLGLSLEASKPLGLAREVAAHRLDGDVASQLFVPSTPDLSHSARANASRNPLCPDLFSLLKRHWRGSYISRPGARTADICVILTGGRQM